MEHLYSVGLGEYVISHDPLDVLVAYGLGSCLGIGMFDPVARVAGLLHAVLPEHQSNNGQVPTKFVDTGIVYLMNALIKTGANRSRLVVWMAGGANMITSTGVNKVFDIGSRNIQTAMTVFGDLRVRLSGQEIGGFTGRTVRVYVGEGRMTVRTIGQTERNITTWPFQRPAA